jgi:hypothetical protein
MADGSDNAATLTFHSARGAQPRVEVLVPKGTTLEVSRKLESLIYEKIGPEILNIAACSNCRSGLDILVRERFDDVIRVDLDSFKVTR